MIDPVRRRVLLTLAWLSCVLCAAAWVGRYGYVLTAFHAGRGVLVARGGVYFLGPSVLPNESRLALARGSPGERLTLEGYAGTRVRRGRPLRVLDLRAYGDCVVLALWVPTLALAAPPLWLTRRYRRRRPPGLCLHCGYDLRATPERCPERLC